VVVGAEEIQQIAIERREKVEEFQRRHRVGLLTLLFTDIIASTKLKQELGEREGIAAIRRHHAMIREVLSQFREGEEIETAGDSFFIVFTKPSDAVKFSLLIQARLRAEAGRAVFDRIGIHVGEVWIEEHDEVGKARDLYGIQVDTCARVQSLGEADQILLTRFPFDAHAASSQRRRTQRHWDALVAQSRPLHYERPRGAAGNLRSRGIKQGEISPTAEYRESVSLHLARQRTGTGVASGGRTSGAGNELDIGNEAGRGELWRGMAWTG
jgi:class 3 adenylate cyclase